MTVFWSSGTFIHINIDITSLLYRPKTKVLQTYRMTDGRTVRLTGEPKSIFSTFNGQSEGRTDPK